MHNRWNTRRKGWTPSSCSGLCGIRGFFACHRIVLEDAGERIRSFVEDALAWSRCANDCSGYSTHANGRRLVLQRTLAWTALSEWKPLRRLQELAGYFHVHSLQTMSIQTSQPRANLEVSFENPNNHLQEHETESFDTHTMLTTYTILRPLFPKLRQGLGRNIHERIFISSAKARFLCFRTNILLA